MQRVVGVAVALLMTISAAPIATAQETTDVPCATNAAASAADDGAFRFFCEPMDSTFFIQFEQFEAGLAYLEENYPDYVEVKVIGESLQGRPIYFVEVTNEHSLTPREDKLQIGYSASIHANEAAGREGMARMIEDLAGGIGPHGADLQPYLEEVLVNVWFPNPDSWASGDYFSSTAVNQQHSGGFSRTNAANVDLNREFPNPGLIHKDHTPMSEPESQAVVKELRFSGNHSNLVAGTDLHGMINSENMMRMIIPNQDYDFRRMVLSVDQLRTIEERVDDDPAFQEWKEAGSLGNMLSGATDELPDEVPDPSGAAGGVAPAKPLQWGARWDMIGYTDTGFTSDYLMLSPRSPTGGMGAVGTITEFAYSHMVPDNNYVAKLTDMHVAGVRHIVKAQIEMAGRLDSPVLAGTGPVAYLDDGSFVSSDDDPAAYEVGRAFDRSDPDTWFDFDQVEYNVTNLRFWRDLARFTVDPIEPIATEGFDAAAVEGYDHLIITNQVIDALDDGHVTAIRSWVEDGGHLLLTDKALQFFDRADVGPAAKQIETYLGYSDVQDWDHPIMDDVTWDARVTGEGPAIGMHVGGPYPQWVLDGAPDGDVVGTTEGQPSLGRVPVGEGSIDYLGGALPMPRQATGDNMDHRYGLADYSVSAFTYWIVMNSLGGEVEWQPIDEPFVPYYDFDPLNAESEEAAPETGDTERAPGAGMALVSLGVVAVALAIRRR